MTPIQEANRVLKTFAPFLEFIWVRNRLCLRYETYSGDKYVVGVRVEKHSGALCINCCKMGMGGTMAMAVGQLARWIRGQSRVPISAWRYWASDKVMLARSKGTFMVQYIVNSSYSGYDNNFTRCVLCGADKCSDWWCKDGLIGPCCLYGRCQNRSAKTCKKR